MSGGLYQRGLVSFKEAMEMVIMKQQGTHKQETVTVEQYPLQLCRATIGGNTQDIEVIDLDNPREQIKPTTWHK